MYSSTARKVEANGPFWKTRTRSVQKSTARRRLLLKKKKNVFVDNNVMGVVRGCRGVCVCVCVHTTLSTRVETTSTRVNLRISLAAVISANE